MPSPTLTAPTDAQVDDHLYVAVSCIDATSGFDLSTRRPRRARNLFRRSMRSEYSVADWMLSVHSDLALAQFEPKGAIPPELLCFLAQQAAERSVEAVILHQTGELARKTHDLVLSSLDAQHVGAPLPADLVGEVANLNQYAVITRYPANFGEPDEDACQRAISTVYRSVAWAEGVVIGADAS